MLEAETKKMEEKLDLVKQMILDSLELMEFTGIMVKSYLDTSTLEDNISTIILRIFSRQLS